MQEAATFRSFNHIKSGTFYLPQLGVVGGGELHPRKPCLDLTFTEKTRPVCLLLNDGHSLFACALSFLWLVANSIVSLSGVCAACQTEAYKAVCCATRPVRASIS